MIPPLVRLPTTTLGHDGLEDLAACAELLGADRVVLVGTQRDEAGRALDAFVVAAALVARRPGARLGVVVTIGEGREPSIVAREATALQLLGACEMVVLEGAAASCRDAALVIEALFTEGEHTVTTPTAHVEHARNLPLPDVAGGPPVLWREGGVLQRLVAKEPTQVGAVQSATSPTELPATSDGVLVELDLAVSSPAAVLAALTT